MEARRLHDPSLGMISDDQAQSPMRATSSCVDLWQKKHVLSQPVEAIVLVIDLYLPQNHDVRAAKLYLPDGLRDPKAPAVANVEGP